jgi:hypothetical protein
MYRGKSTHVCPKFGGQADSMTTGYAQIRVKLLIRGTKDDI